jgi:transcriptional regulator with GAF, ATPase, and Fis domain
VSVNCAALPETLIESELFGHERGAFTGALERRRGRFELASGGTLFLDEIGDLPLPLQAKLLRVLEEGQVERVGGSEAILVDVRVIGSTHRDLLGAVEAGEFRADLYYRIGGFPIRVPPLRDRAGDIELLAGHFVQKHSRRLGREVDSISARTLGELRAYSWPGNVRELEHVIERGLIAATGPVLDLAEPLEAVPAAGAPLAEAPVAGAASLQEVQRNHIAEVLEKTNWVIEGKRGAAELLRIPASTLRSRMKRLGITRPA